jgi:hypothetical protein
LLVAPILMAVIDNENEIDPFVDLTFTEVDESVVVVIYGLDENLKETGAFAVVLIV